MRERLSGESGNEKKHNYRRRANLEDGGNGRKGRGGQERKEGDKMDVQEGRLVWRMMGDTFTDTFTDTVLIY